MTEHDNLLIEQFFSQAAGQQLADDGFTRRVMNSLPQPRRQWRLSRLWTLFCTVMAIVLFTAVQGWQNIVAGLEVMLRTAPTEFNLMMPVAVMAGLAIATATEIGYSSRWRW